MTPSPQPPQAQRAGSKKVGHRRPMQTLCAHVQVVSGAQGCAALLLPAPQGISLIGAKGGGCAVAHTVWDGKSMWPLPPWPGGWR